MRGSPSGGASHDRVYSRSRDRWRGTILLTLAPARRRVAGIGCTRRPFRRRARRSPPRRRTGSPLPCSAPARRADRSRGPHADSYSGHTPGLRRFDHGADQSPAPGTTPAAAALPRLAMNSSGPVTSLARATVRVPGRMSRVPSGIVSAGGPSGPRRFRGAKRRNSPLPVSLGFFAVRHRLRLGSLTSPSVRASHG
jgi:hypothetical protein